MKTSIFGFTKTTNGHPKDSLVTFVDMRDDGHEVRVGHGRRDSGRWGEISNSVKRAVRDRIEDPKTRSWRSPIFTANDLLAARGVRPNPWPQSDELDYGTAISEWHEARAERFAAEERMIQVLTEAGIGGFDV